MQQACKLTGKAVATCSHMLRAPGPVLQHARLIPASSHVPVPQQISHQSGHALVCRAEAGMSPSPAPPAAEKKKRGRPRKQTEASRSPPQQQAIPEPVHAQVQSPQEAAAHAMEQEIALQEKEADLTIDDIIQMQYEVPTDEQIDQEVEEILQEQPQQPSAVQQQAQHANQGFEPSQGLSRKAAILLEIVSAAAGPELDTKIAQFAEDIDDELLDMLQVRIDMVAKVNHAAAEQLRELQGVLRVVHMRQEATPAQRLLDDVLDILGDDMTNTQAYSVKRLEAMARLREAFQGGAGPGLDLFAAAAALAAGGPLAAAELAGEAVDPVEFMTETTLVLDQTKTAQQELGAQIERAQKEVAYLQKNQPETLQGPRASEFMSQLTHARRVHAQRAIALGQLQDILLMARQIQNSRDLGHSE